MVCKKCGYEIKEENNFCPNCGEKKEQVTEEILLTEQKKDANENNDTIIDNKNNNEIFLVNEIVLSDTEKSNEEKSLVNDEEKNVVTEQTENNSTEEENQNEDEVNNINETEDITCGECNKKVSPTDKKCPHCGYDLKIYQKTFITISVIIALVIIVLIGIESFKNIETSKKVDKYNEAIQLYEIGNYDEAKEIFIDLSNDDEFYNGNPDAYIKIIDSKNLLEQEKYGEALNILENIYTNEIEELDEMKEFASIGKKFQNEYYHTIYEDYKYKTTFYNNKEKEMISEARYQVGLSYYKYGQYTTAKEIFETISDYKDVSKILSDKYFGLIGNYFAYSYSEGYNWGLIGILFYSYGDTVNYNVFYQSLFNTDIPSGREYKYVIQKDYLFFGETCMFKIVSFNGTDLVLRDEYGTYTLTKQ